MRPALFVLAAAMCFSTTGTAQAFGPDGASSAAVGLTRVVVGGLLLGAVAWWLGRRSGLRAPALTGARLGVALVGGAGVVGYQLTFFAAARLNGVVVGAVVALGAAPVLTGVLEWVVTRTAPCRAWFVATGCAVVGVVLLSGLLDGAGGDVSLVGLVASLGAALSYAIYALATKRFLDEGATPVASIGGIFGTAAVLGLPFLLLVDLSWLGSSSGVGMVVWLAVMTVAVAYVLFAIGLRALAASTVSTLTLAEPVAACLLGVVLLDERLTTTGWIGLVVLLGGVVLLAVPARREEPVPA